MLVGTSLIKMIFGILLPNKIPIGGNMHFSLEGNSLKENLDMSRLRVATLKVHNGVRSFHQHGLQVVSQARIFPLVSVIQRPYHWSGDSKLTGCSLASELVRSYASKAASAKPKAAKKESKSSSSSGGKKKKKCPKKEVEVKKEEKKKTCEKKKYTPKCR